MNTIQRIKQTARQFLRRSWSARRRKAGRGRHRIESLFWGSPSFAALANSLSASLSTSLYDGLPRPSSVYRWESTALEGHRTRHRTPCVERLEERLLLAALANEVGPFRDASGSIDVFYNQQTDELRFVIRGQPDADFAHVQVDFADTPESSAAVYLSNVTTGIGKLFEQSQVIVKNVTASDGHATRLFFTDEDFDVETLPPNHPVDQAGVLTILFRRAAETIETLEIPFADLIGNGVVVSDGVTADGKPTCVKLGDRFNVAGELRHADPNLPTDVEIDFGDGTFRILELPPGETSFDASHFYLTNGEFTVNITAKQGGKELQPSCFLVRVKGETFIDVGGGDGNQLRIVGGGAGGGQPVVLLNGNPLAIDPDVGFVTFNNVGTNPMITVENQSNGSGKFNYDDTQTNNTRVALEFVDQPLSFFFVAGTPVRINGGSGEDTLNVTTNRNSARSRALTFDGGDGENSVTFTTDDFSEVVDLQQISAPQGIGVQIDGSSSFLAVLNAFGVTNFVINMLGGNDFVSLLSDFGVPITVTADLGEGNDNFDSSAATSGNVTTNVDGGPGDDRFTGSSAIDIQVGGAGDDNLSGGGGDDEFFPGSGNDSIFGSGVLHVDATDAGENSAFLSGTGNTLVFDGVEGVTYDQNVFSQAISPMATLTGSGFQYRNIIGSGGDDNFSNAINVDAGAGNDNITGTSGPNVLTGGLGRDNIEGGDGDDRIEAGSGDSADGGNADDITGWEYDIRDNFWVEHEDSPVVFMDVTVEFFLINSDNISTGNPGLPFVANFTPAVRGVTVDFRRNDLQIADSQNNGLQLDGPNQFTDIVGSQFDDEFTIVARADAPLTVDGGDPAGEVNGDRVIIDAEGRAVTQNGNVIDICGRLPITLTGIEDVQIINQGVAQVFDLTEADDDALLRDDGNGDFTLVSRTGTFADIPFTPTAAGVVINALGGNDIIDASAATFTVVLNGGDDNDTLIGGVENDKLDGGPGNDDLTGNAGADLVLGGSDDDTARWSDPDGDGDDGADDVDLGTGSGDRLILLGSNDSSETGDPHDGFFVHEAAPRVGIGDGNLAGAAFDITHAFPVVPPTTIETAGVEELSIDGRAGDDTLDALGFPAGLVHLSLLGGPGFDDILGSEGGDTIDGGDGLDVITALGGDDDIAGGPGNDLFRWNRGDGADDVDGGEGNDTFRVFSDDEAGETISLAPADGGGSLPGAELSIVQTTPVPATIELKGIEDVEVATLGGDDVVSVGGDSVTVDGSVFIQGGEGNNELRFTGQNITLDATQVFAARNFNQVDIRGSGPNTLLLDKDAVDFVTDAANALTLHAQLGDTVGVGEGWTLAGTEISGGAFFRILEQAGTTLRLNGPAHWQNPLNPLDINNSNSVDPIDALVIINELNDPRFSGALSAAFDPVELAGDSDPTNDFDNLFRDTNADSFFTPIDGLIVINFLNASDVTGEGEDAASRPSPTNLLLSLPGTMAFQGRRERATLGQRGGTATALEGHRTKYADEADRVFGQVSAAEFSALWSWAIEDLRVASAPRDSATRAEEDIELFAALDETFAKLLAD